MACLCLPTVLSFLLLPSADAEQTWTADIFDGIERAVIAKDPSAMGRRCIVANMGLMSGNAFEAYTPVLQPGEYSAAVRLKLPYINNMNTAPLHWVFAAGEAGKGSRGFDILLIEKAGEYQEIRCPFVVEKSGEVSFTLNWKRSPLKKESKATMKVEKKDIPTSPYVPGEEEDDMTESDIEVELSDEPPLAGLKYLTLAIDNITVTKVSDIGITKLEVDKIRYKPGEKARASISIRNYKSTKRELSVETFLVHDLDRIIPVDKRKIEVGASATYTFECEGPAFVEKWGYAIRGRVSEDNQLLLEKSEYFTVHDNMWAISVTGSRAAQFTAHISESGARRSAELNKRKYQNFIESGFWAPSDFGDFTPDTERWWGGQGCYYGSVSGTKALIAEGHKKGLSFAVYAFIWGGDGPPAYELIRENPDFGYAHNFNVEWFEKWNSNSMGTGSKKYSMHVWPATIIKHRSDNKAIEHHARELIGTNRMFGWDAVRYDSHGLSDHTARLVSLTQKFVHAEVPEFQFGYNCSVPGRDPSILEAFKTHCKGGRLIMEEGIRQYGAGGLSFAGQRTYEVFARRILDFKEEARESGGHFMAIGMDKCFPNDLIYQYIFWLAGNTHTCYGWRDTSVANYLQFATRFAGQIWDLKVKPVPNPEKWLNLGKAEEFLFLWKDYVHQRDMGNGKRQFILHLINAPKETNLYKHEDAKVPPPRANIPIGLKLPGKAKVKNVWFLTPEYQLTEQKLPFSNEETGVVQFTVPRIRFWSTVVVELEDAPVFK